MKKLTVSIVSYNVKYYLEQCLTSVLWALRDIDSEVIVVDNHSKDGSVEYLREKFGKKIRIVASNHNLGFSKANNIAIQQSEGEYVLLLNPDTVVTENSLKEMVAFMDLHPKAGGLGVKMIRSNGSKAMESRRGIPTPSVSFYKMMGLCNRFPKSERFGKYYMCGMSWDEPGKMEIISGACCMMRKKALDEVGLMDEDYFMYGEDIDISYRLLQQGWENWYLPTSILHYKGESTHKSSFRYVHVFYNAMLIFYRKHFSGYSFFVSLPIKIAIFVKAIMTLISLSMKEWRDYVGLRRNCERQQPVYVFIGTKYTLSQCKEIAREKGLDAEFHEGTVGTMPEGHNSLHLTSDKQKVIVYDVHAFSYNEIFDIFEKHPANDVIIGTYDNNTRKIITPDEVIFTGEVLNDE